MSADGWALDHVRGSAVDFHARSVPERTGRQVWWFELERPAIVLGSTQDEEIVDHAQAQVTGTEVVHRRSGGGAVHLVPGEVTWVDVILPAGDRWWDDDVGRSFSWLGEVWREVLARFGVSPVRVHDGPLQTTPWSSLVCFAGVGPGEVLVGDRKVVGISQRRSRAGARFQCALLHRWDPAATVALLALEADRREAALRELPATAGGLADVPSAAAVEALLEVLATR